MSFVIPKKYIEMDAPKLIMPTPLTFEDCVLILNDDEFYAYANFDQLQEELVNDFKIAFIFFYRREACLKALDAYDQNRHGRISVVLVWEIMPSSQETFKSAVLNNLKDYFERL